MKKDNKMISIEIKFYTNEIDGCAEGQIIPKNMHEAGWVIVLPNNKHGIERKKGVPFHSLKDLPNAINEAIIKNQLVVQVK